MSGLTTGNEIGVDGEKLDLILAKISAFDERLMETHRAVLDIRVDLHSIRGELLALNRKMDEHIMRPHNA